jgi:hypothetical protein
LRRPWPCKVRALRGLRSHRGPRLPARLPFRQGLVAGSAGRGGLQASRFDRRKELFELDLMRWFLHRTIPVLPPKLPIRSCGTPCRSRSPLSLPALACTCRWTAWEACTCTLCIETRELERARTLPRPLKAPRPSYGRTARLGLKGGCSPCLRSSCRWSLASVELLTLEPRNLLLVSPYSSKRSAAWMTPAARSTCFS